MLTGSLRRGWHAEPRESYLEISNFIRGRRRKPLAFAGCRIAFKNAFHIQNCLLNQMTPHLDLPRPQFLQQYKQAIDFLPPTYDFDTFLTHAKVGQTVVLHGYLGDRADLSKKLAFVRLTEPTMKKYIQIISFAKNDAFERLKSISPNSPVAVRGKVQRKKESKSKPESGKGERSQAQTWEIDLEEIHPLNEFPKDIIVAENTVFPPEQRHLQLRFGRKLRDALRFRAKAKSICRAELEQCRPSFIEIETPLLFKSTPEGAREFLVPTRKRGLAYALPQSPQQYKQILMASGLSRYYQFARCFRDEDLRADRQPEFTQLDLEMSFATGEDVMQTVERVIRRLWTSLVKQPVPTGPFRRMPYKEAMARYGSDKPDTRYGMEIHQIDYLLPADLVSKITPLSDNPIVEAFKLEGIENDPASTSRFISQFLDSPAGAVFNHNLEGAPGILVYDAKKPLRGLQPLGFEAAERAEELFQLDHGDALILQARKRASFTGGSTTIGDLRRAIHSTAVAAGFKPASRGFHFLWVIDFPLFSPSSASEPGQGGTAGISSTHHPFTAPKTAADVDMLLTDPTLAVADHYDLVVNGVELGGGSRRIHDAAVQEFILRDILRMPPERLGDFSHLLDALRAGCPPHAGLALGFDRLVAVMLGRESVRDVIAFPKTGKGEDAMVKAPSEMTRHALETYHLRLTDE